MYRSRRSTLLTVLVAVGALVLGGAIPRAFGAGDDRPTFSSGPANASPSPATDPGTAALAAPSDPRAEVASERRGRSSDVLLLLAVIAAGFGVGLRALRTTRWTALHSRRLRIGPSIGPRAPPAAALG